MYISFYSINRSLCHGLIIETIPAYNLFPKPFHTKSKNWQGYLVKMDGVSYYVGGKFTMDKKQAADYITTIKPKAVIPTHYGEMVGTPADGSDFKDYVENADRNIQVELKL